MQRLKERVDGSASVGDLVDELLSETGYVDALKAERTIEAQGRLENLEELVHVAREYDATNPEGSLDEFLQQIALLADADTIRDDEGLVTLMTLHNAKGLEFPIVFIIGMEDGVFPHARALDDGSLEEERRLCYVGLTRAMRDLTLTYARRRNAFGTRSFGMRSRFLDEIPGELTDADSRPAPITSWGATTAPAPVADAQIFRTGEDVVHPKFGEGVVTGLEPGGIVVVRFAGDGAERKLMADYAPIRRR
jgi:DNA helicase II / ATP-dependent DNA helicase PcrA